MADDAVKIAPHVYVPVIDNDRVRVLESRMRPGDRTALHAHPDMVVVALDAATYRFTSGGRTVDVEVAEGRPMFMDAMEHETECIATNDHGEARTLLIELKP